MTHFPILNICLWLDLAISSPSNLAREFFYNLFPSQKRGGDAEEAGEPREKTDTS